MANKNKALPFLIQGSAVVVIVDNKSYTINKDSHISYAKIVDAIKSEDWDTVRELVEPKVVIINYGKGNIKIENNVIYWKNEVFHNSLATRMIKMFQEGFPIDPMIKFMGNLLENPSARSVEQLYGFLDKNGLPITDDGHFLAYKKVNKDYKDIYTGKIDNSVGQLVEMERNKVNDNPDQTCSYGLHFCSQSYLGSFGSSGDPVMILKINPKDVVSIPSDYNGSKGRCCKYEVVGEVGKSVDDEDFNSAVNTQYSKPEKVTPSPAKSWPFPTDRPDESPTPPAAKKKSTKEKLYDLVRVHSPHWIEYTNLTKSQAQDIIDRHVRQKKVKLEMVLL